MTNAQHSASTGEWYTGGEWSDVVRTALGGIIFLDPCSSAKANTLVKAVIYGTEADNLLDRDWRELHEECTTAFVNPPGTCTKVNGLYSVCGNPSKCSCSLSKKFLRKCIEQAHNGMDIVYLAYSVNQLRQLANLEIPADVKISIAIPSDRIPFTSPETMAPVKGTNCDSAFLCIAVDLLVHMRFWDAFEEQGCTVFRSV